MEEARRQLEQRALQNVRQLVDRLEEEERRQVDGRKFAIGVVALALGAVAVIVAYLEFARDDGKTAIDRCVARKVEAWMADVDSRRGDTNAEDFLKFRREMQAQFPEKAFRECASGRSSPRPATPA